MKELVYVRIAMLMRYNDNPYPLLRLLQHNSAQVIVFTPVGECGISTLSPSSTGVQAVFSFGQQ